MALKKIIKYITKRGAMALYGLYASVQLPALYDREHRQGNLSYLSESDYLVWKKAMLSLLREHAVSGYGLRQRELFTAFATAKIRVIRKREGGDADTPIVVLCVKNDRRRIEMLVKHYRGLGVKHFAFLDNGSTDGTLEWMTEQEDIELFATDDTYSSFAKEAWINRIVGYYGFDRWYIVTDSDELIAHTGMEAHPLTDVTAYAVKNGISRIEALTLDMYADAALFSEDPAQSDIRQKYCWMDSDSYIENKRQVGREMITAITGGPRMRTMDVSTSLMKYPLVYFAPGTVSANAHFQYPYSEINKCPCHFAILHYKFLEEDKKEYARRADKGSGFAFGGGYYRSYMNAAEGSSTFMYEGSLRYEDSKSLAQLPIIKPIPFEENEA